MPSFELPTWTSFAEYLAAPDLAAISLAFFVAASVLMAAVGAVTLSREVRRRSHDSGYSS